MPRIKDVTLDGVTLTISAFSLDKAAELFPGPGQRTDEENIAMYFRVITESLNGAGGDANLWTRERIYREFDQVLITWLHQQILDFNGIKVPKRGEEKAAAA